MDSLGEGTALANQHDISFLDGEGRGYVGRDVAVTLLVPVVLRHIVQVVTTYNHSALHLSRDDNALEDLATDGHARGEGTLAVNVVRLDGLLGSLEAKTNILVVPHS